MQVLAIDYESFWSADYTLNKLTPLEYVMDPRWECQALTITHEDERSTTAIGHTEIQQLTASYDWRKYMVIGHNLSVFDAYVAALRYAINPALWGCTLAMARPWFGRTVGLSLKSLCKHFGIGVKDDRILHSTKGRRLAEFTPEEIQSMRIYNCDDGVLCMRLFKVLKKYFTAQELWHIDCLIRMRTEPAFELDELTLEEALVAEEARQRGALDALSDMLGFKGDTVQQRVEQVRMHMASAPKFAQLLTDLNVPVPMKASPTNPDRMIPALAKTDVEFVALQEHDNPIVAEAARMRLDVKSTLTQTRIQAFRRAGNLTGGFLPIPLRYCGAMTTGRDSGEEYNALNLPRIDPKNPKPSDALRNSMCAPAGYVIVVIDFSGIELRVNHYLWQVRKTMKLFNADPKADLYIANAQDQYGRLEISKAERQVEKIKQLGLGFGAGWFTFKRVARGMGVQLTDQQAEEYVVQWRTDHIEIAGKGGGWALCQQAIENMHNRVSPYWLDPWGLVEVTPDGFSLPSGRMILYPDLRMEPDGEWDDGRPKTSWFYGHNRNKRRIYGPKADENVVQAIARDIMGDACIEIWKQTKFRPALRVYDELVYVVPEKEGPALLELSHKVMRKSPVWWPELVLWSEGSMDVVYGAAK